MKSIRHTQAETGTPAGIVPDDVVLDAARESILAVGWRRSTLTDVARRAGVSRMTLYRRWDDMGSLLGDLMTREWTRMLTTVAQAPHSGDAADRIADQVVAMLAQLRVDPLFRRILDVDPELLLPYLLDRRGRSQELVLQLFAEAIREGQRAGEIRLGRPAVLARALLLTSHGFALSAQTMTEPRVASLGALEDELRVLIRRFLQP